jgi:hypothetical protein
MYHTLLFLISRHVLISKTKVCLRTISMFIFWCLDFPLELHLYPCMMSSEKYKKRIGEREEEEEK